LQSLARTFNFWRYATPTRDEVLKDLARRVIALEKRLDEVEQNGPENWDEEIGLGLDYDEPAAEPEPEPEQWARREVNGNFEYRSPVNEKHRAFRERLAKAMAWVDWERPLHLDSPLPISEEVGIPAFIEGGAMWIYDYDRDFIFLHGTDIFAGLVTDVLYTGDEALAQELSADLFKDRDQGPLGESDTLDIATDFAAGGSGGNWAGGNRQQ